MPELIEAAGLVLVTVAAFIVSPALGFFVAGLSLVATGTALSLREGKPK